MTWSNNCRIMKGKVPARACGNRKAKHGFKKGDTEGIVNYALSLSDTVLAAIFIEDRVLKYYQQLPYFIFFNFTYF